MTITQNAGTTASTLGVAASPQRRPTFSDPIVAFVCHTCAVFIAYGDDSGQDVEQIAECEATILALQDQGGTLVVEDSILTTTSECDACHREVADWFHAVSLVR